MKKISEELPGTLRKVSDGTLVTVNEKTKRTLTPSVGSETTDITKTGPSKRPDQDQIQDILWKLSTIKPWKIQPGDTKDAKNALKLLVWVGTPATRDEITYWLTRLLAHFPRRDVSKDAVVISDLVMDMIDENVSLMGLVAACNSIRKNSREKGGKKFLPVSGEILDRAISKTENYWNLRAKLIKMQEPKPELKKIEEKPEKPWIGKPWKELADNVKAELWEFLKGFGNYELAKFYAKTIELDYDAVIEEMEDEREEDGTE